jgi:TPR repeat protein
MRLLQRAKVDAASTPTVARNARRWPAAPLALTTVFLGFLLAPPVRDHPSLRWTFAGTGVLLFLWSVALWWFARRRGRVFGTEFVPVKSHWVQACVQFGIIVYWGWFWPRVYPELPLIAAQVIFLYSLDALVSWSRGRTWRFGFGPLPIVISTNLLLWFKDDVYYLQFVMLTIGFLGKEFITWIREGKRTHIFNPSAFGQSVVALVLIAMGMTNELTWGQEIAASFDPRHMLIVIFLGGLVVQYFFEVTLMTVASIATLVLFGLVYQQATGLYFFVNTNVAGPIFLGMHLLVTDPATSPRTNLGRVLFGGLYALGYIALFRIFDLAEIPLFWDKLLPVPVLNLCVPLIDRVMRNGALGRLNFAWQGAIRPARMNLIHMGAWIAFFTTMLVTGFIDAPHPGDSIPFWKRAVVDGRPHAGHSLVIAAGAQALGGNSSSAYNELGLICVQGKIVNENHGTAAKHFAKACEMKDMAGCVNVAIQYLFIREYVDDESVQQALDLLEGDCEANGSTHGCYLLGVAYENGRGRPMDKERALALYQRCGPTNAYAAKGIARILISGVEAPFDIGVVVRALAASASQGDAESCWYMGYMYRDGIGLRRVPEKASEMMQRACTAGSEPACTALTVPGLPPYANPVMVAPGWVSAYPVQNPMAAPKAQAR